MTHGAKFWAVDLHTHTPASRDVIEGRYGALTPAEVVAAAVSAGLDLIAVTDHNTAAWCDEMALAAQGTTLTVLPGVEISTTEGHLLAIWEKGTPATVINDLLARLYIMTDDRGKLDIAASAGFAESAAEVAQTGGIAIAAHIDRPKGLLSLSVAAHVKKILLSPDLSAVEVVDPATATIVSNKLGLERNMACIRSSDATLPGQHTHVVAGIGSRRTWIKAGAPDLLGIVHALGDPSLRIRLEEPLPSAYPAVTAVEFERGFLAGQRFDLCRDLNCLLGGTGAGKSLILEAIRFGLDQQVDRTSLAAIAAEVESRLNFAVGDGGRLTVHFEVGSEAYRVERTFRESGSGPPVVHQRLEDDWRQIDVDLRSLIPIAAFSQGEILEYAREPVGRMSLIDSALDLGECTRDINAVVDLLRKNGAELLAARKQVEKLRGKVETEVSLKDRVAELTPLFDTDKVELQGKWSAEASTLQALLAELPDSASVAVPLPQTPGGAQVPSNTDLFDEAKTVIEALRRDVSAGVQAARSAIENAKSSLLAVDKSWKSRHGVFTHQVEEELASAGQSGQTLKALRSQLEKAQTDLAQVVRDRTDLRDVAEPLVANLLQSREDLLAKLQALRTERRTLRRARVGELSTKTAGIVRLNVPGSGATSDFEAALSRLKVGSNVRDSVIASIAANVHPFSLVRAFLANDLQSLVSAENGIDLSSLARLQARIEDHQLWSELLEIQTIERADLLDIKFKKPDDGVYVPIEELAHGQKCTAILVMLLADGNTPVIVDQPEDALHAPWIEDYLVDRLRGLRGSRQYIFATRSPGIVIGADAEQIVTLRATAGRGELEASASLERHDLNLLALHHLEGGATAFKRRSGKLAPSIGA